MSEPSNELDRRATRAADDLREMTAAGPRPAFDADRLANSSMSRSSNRIPRLLAVAAALILVAGAALLLWPREEEAENIVAGPPGEIPGQILDPTPEGFTAFAMEWTLEDREADDESNMPSIAVEPQPWHLYGPVGERAELALFVDLAGFDEARASWDDDGEPEVLDLAGRRAYRDHDDLGSLGSNAIVVEVDDVVVAVFGSVDLDELEAIAAEVTVENGEPVIDPNTLPEGWEAGEVVDPGGLGFPYMTRSDSKISFYMTEESDPVDPGFTMIQVATWAGSVKTPPDLGGLLPVLDQTVEEAEVNGRPAVLLTTPVEGDDVGVHSIAWEPEPGLSVSLYAYGIDLAPADVIALAETVRPATTDEWQTMLDRADESADHVGRTDTEETIEAGDDIESSPPHPTVPEVERSDDPVHPDGRIGTGTSPELSWVAEVEDGLLSIRIEDAESGTSDPVPVEEPLAIASATSGEHMVLAGIIDGNQDVLVEEEGERIEMTWTIPLEDGRKLWAAQVGRSRATVTFIAVGGSELSRHEFEHASP